MAKLIDSKKRNTGWFYLFAFLIPVIVMLCSFAALKIYPFGNESLIRHDAHAYYLPFLSYSGSVLRGEHGLLYSFSQDIGGSIIATIWPYLANPFSWIFSLFQYENYHLAYSLGVLLFIGLDGLFMFLLYKDMYEAKPTGVILSTCYALCGFNVGFVVNTAFFGGGPLFLPLALLGLRKLLRGESPWIYAISIAWSIILQIQMGFAICMACALFYVAYVFCHSGTLKRTWLRFGVTSVASGFLSAIVWIPEMVILGQGRGILSIEDFAFSSNFPITRIISRFFTGSHTVSQVWNGLPAVFCGILPIALMILFFMDRKTDRRRKLVYSVLLGVYMLGFYIWCFTSIFQGMTHANWFNYRFSFVFILIVLLTAADELERLDRITLKQVYRCGLGILLAALFIFSWDYEFVDGSKMLLDLLLLAVMGGGLWFYKQYPEKAPKSILILLLALCTFFQLYLNCYFSMNNILKVWKFNEADYQESILAKEPLIKGIMGKDESFYRIESEKLVEGSIGNDGLLLGYNGVGYAGHTEVGWVTVALGRLGIDLQHATWVCYNPGAPAAMDSLLGIKYMVSDRDLNKEKGYQSKVSLFGQTLYENPYVLPIAILSNDAIASVSMTDELNALDNLNHIWSGITGEDSKLFTEETEITFSNHNPTDRIDIRYDEVDRSEHMDSVRPAVDNTDSLTSAALEKDAAAEVLTSEVGETITEEDPNRYSAYIEYRFEAKKTGPIYLYDTSPIEEGIGSSDDVMQYVGLFKEGDMVVGKIYLPYNIDEKVMLATLRGLHICYADMETLSIYSEKLKAELLTIQKNSDSHLSGEVTAMGDQRLLFTIPYDEGWMLFVDGKEVPLEKTASLFMSARLDPGTHHYELNFWPKGLTKGVMISGGALATLIILSIILITKKKKNKLAEKFSTSSVQNLVSNSEEESIQTNEGVEEANTEIAEANTTAGPESTE